MILAGGSGTRLWPLSREARPKQFLKLCGKNETLLQLTASRLKRVARDVRVIAASRWRDEIERELAPLGLTNVCIEEPEPRGTAAAVALAASELLRGGADENDVVLICPSDHLIADERAFEDAAREAIDAAEAGGIVTFGIKPTRPKTGFGYIKATPGSGALSVERFVEKPDAATAQRYIDEGHYFWNGGCFCFRISEMRAAFEACFPEGAKIFARGAEESAAAFRACRKVSIDVAVMEKTSGIKCVPLDAGWTDVGSWDAVWDASERDTDENSALGAALFDVGGSVVIEETSGKLVCAIDVDDLVIIDTPDALLVAPRSSSQRLSEIVKKLAADPTKRSYL